MTTPEIALSNHLAAIHHASIRTPAPWGAPEIQSFLADETVICCHRDQGFILVRVLADEAEILTLAVDPTARRTGIARGLLADALEKAQDAGATRCFLEVAVDNVAAIALYRSFRFEPIGLRKRYYLAPNGQRIDAQVFSREMTDRQG